MTKKTQKIVLSICATAVGCGVLIPGIVVTATSNANYIKAYDNENLNFDGQNFNTKQELIDYAMKNVKVFNNSISSPSKWSLRVNGEEKFFNSPLDIENYLGNKIKEIDVSTSMQIQENSSGEISPSELDKLSEINAKTIDIYRGRNNTVCSSVEQAKNTYLEIHDAYLFQNIYFRTKEELVVYLKQNNSWMQEAEIKSIVLLSPSGFKSNPIEIEKIKKNDPKAIKYLKSFIKQNSENYFSLDVDVGNSVDKKYYKDLSDPSISNSFDPTYTEVVSNGGKGNYIIDTDLTDEATLYGPYYVKSSNSILGISDKDNWRKIQGTDQKFFDDTKNLSLISTFFNLILGINSSTDDGSIFNISKKLNVEIKKYFNTLKAECPEVYYSVNNIYTTMKKGKRYGEFYKLPILFVHTIDQMIYRSIPQKYIDQTREIYTKICKYYDDQLNSLIPQKMLVGLDGSTFTFADLFGINKPNLDLNYDVESLIGIIMDKYPNLFQAIQFFNVAYANLNQSSNTTLIGDDKEVDIKYLTEFTGLNLNTKFAYEYELMFKLLKSKNQQEVKDISKEINPKNTNIESTFVTTNFVLNYAKDEVIKRIIEFFINPSEAIAKHNYDKEQINLLKTVKFLDFSPTNGQYEGVDEVARYNHEFIRETFNKNANDINTDVFTNLAILQKSKPSFKFPEEWKDLTLPELNEKVVGLLKIFFPNVLRDIRFIWNKFNEIYACLNANNLIHFATVLLPTILENLKSIVDLNTEYSYIWDYFDQMFTKCKKVLIKVIDNLDETALNFANDLLMTCKDLFEDIELLTDLLGTVNTVIKFVKNIHKVEHYSYVFENEDVKYIWNGGVEESWLFGMIKGKVSDASSMKLLEPMSIIKPNINNGYYYNGVVYPNLDILKRAQINDILNNRYKSPKIHTVYAFEKFDQNHSLSTYYSDNLNELVNLVFEDIKNYTTNQTNPIKPPFIVENDFIFSNGIIFDPSKGVDGNINDIIKDIRPVKIATLPTLKTNDSKGNNMPITRDDNLDDKSLPEYKLPERSWNPQEKEVYNNTDNKYVVIDPNSKENNKLTEDEILDKLKIEFYKSFDIERKTILQNDLFNNNLFSKFSSNLQNKKIYWTKGKFNQTKIFSSNYAAMKWLLKNYDFRAYYETSNVDIYIYENKQFNNIDEFLNWVLQTARGEIYE